MRKVYAEGQCRRCGLRVTLDRDDRGHTRDGAWCGPVETHEPFTVPDQNWPEQWRVPPASDRAR
jgi:hypothetical protein